MFTGAGIVLIIIGILFLVFGIGGSAKANISGIGVVVTGGAGLILIIVGAMLLFV
jgi:hypothetical protein